jgi:hypothetical protein
MLQNQIKDLLNSAISKVADHISQYTVCPGRHLTRRKKFPADKLMSFLISQGSSSTKIELLDFFQLDSERVTASALNQQRAKLRPEALQQVMYEFNNSVMERETVPEYRFIAADGTRATFFCPAPFLPDGYYVSEGTSKKGFCSMHVIAFQDLGTHLYTDVLTQPIHEINEYKAFCNIVDRHPVLAGSKNVYVADRGFCSYNNMAHVINAGQYFLFRTKGTGCKGLTGNFDLPQSDIFDTDIDVTLVRRRSKEVRVAENRYRRFVTEKTAFDYIEFGSDETYDISLRLVRFPLSDNTCECLVTNLPREEFHIERLKHIYNTRWGIESSFRKLKHTIGMSNFHSYKPEYIKQEILAGIILYNVTETMINHTIIEQRKTKHAYKANFAVAAHICRLFLRPYSKEEPADIMKIIQSELIPIRNGRQYPREKTARYRRPGYFTYRAV